MLDIARNFQAKDTIKRWVEICTYLLVLIYLFYFRPFLCQSEDKMLCLHSIRVSFDAICNDLLIVISFSFFLFFFVALVMMLVCIYILLKKFRV